MHVTGYAETLDEEYLIMENLNIIKEYLEKKHAKNRQKIYPLRT